MTNPTTPGQVLAAHLKAAGVDTDAGAHDRLVEAYDREVSLTALGMPAPELTAAIDSRLAALGVHRPVSEPTV